ncbi:Ribokinase-like protein [Ilyonectria robusta]|uniref:Ribokinase-like protein n=1 Tax=Ilyonectria robusta TaxID=1079257 RepID=UPI001E8DEE5C|nr:Ribokinase-like protein [Ilyonectria robusta]KAH8654159.1 Ribokinase-like protein [Ilyonectria robusta]
MSPITVAIVGGIITDSFIEIPHMPAPGQVVLGTSIRHRPGGKGANMAVAMHRVSHQDPTRRHAVSRPSPAAERNDVHIYLNGAVGDDEAGARLLAAIAHSGVDVSQVQILQGVQSAAAIMLLGTGGVGNPAPGIIAFRAASKQWRLRDRNGVDCMAAGLRPDLVISDLAISHSEAVQVLATARRQGIDTMLNPGPAVHLEASVFRTVTHLVLNEEEASVLLGRGLEDLKTNRDWAEATECFLQLGVANVVLTLGDKGAYYATSLGERGIVEAEKNIEIVDSTGAGYVFP